MRRPALLLILTVGGTLLCPSAASAHGLGGRADLPIPILWFTWAAVIVLVISFVALAVLWAQPVLERDRVRPLPSGLGRALTSPVVDVACGAIGLALLILVVWAALGGTQTVPNNLAPTFIYVAFWLGLVPLSVLFGDIFRALNPWRAGGRLVGALFGGRAPEPLPYPARLGYWPAALGLFAFGYLELVAPFGDQPRTLGIATLIYSGITWTAMALYGTEAWIARGEAFSVYFNLFSRISIFERRGRTIGVRLPLSGLARLKPQPGLVVLLAVMIGTVSFDGLSGGPQFQERLRDVTNVLRDDVGLGPRPALELTMAVCLVLSILIVFAFYRLGIAGADTVDRRHTSRELARAFVPSLVPIVLAYVAAHYVSLLMFRGQAIAPLASDPLGRGWDLFGTATWTLDYGYISAETFWYLQLGFVIVGHVAALALAHDRALTLYDDPRSATRSQYWMLAVMVGFTVLALWLLSEASKG